MGDNGELFLLQALVLVYSKHIHTAGANFGHSSSLFAVCDPVMGYNGNLFLPAALVPVHRVISVQVAVTLTPNAVEAYQIETCILVCVFFLQAQL